MTIAPGLLAGVATTGQPWTAKLQSILGSTGSGSVLLAAIGAAGIIYLLVTLRPWRSRLIVVAGYVFDFLVTTLFALAIPQMLTEDPYALLPYVLGTMATLLAGAFADYLAPSMPGRMAAGIVSLDMLVFGISGFWMPQPLTWLLVSRVVAGFSAALLGGMIGSYANYVMQKDPHALGRFLGTTLTSLLVATVGGILVVILLK